LARPIQEGPTAVERDAINLIRNLRATSGNTIHAALLASHAALARHLIQTYHGHVKLRFSTVAHAIGVEVRTLERSFARKYGITMCQYQAEVRLEYAQAFLRQIPPAKLSVITSELGYDEVRTFIAFFHTQTHQTPSQWSRDERARTRREELQVDPPPEDKDS
jgi:transcriptional regulator GlxA family with amidase domain